MRPGASDWMSRLHIDHTVPFVKDGSWVAVCNNLARVQSRQQKFNKYVAVWSGLVVYWQRPEGTGEDTIKGILYVSAWCLKQTALSLAAIDVISFYPTPPILLFFVLALKNEQTQATHNWSIFRLPLSILSIYLFCFLPPFTQNKTSVLPFMRMRSVGTVRSSTLTLLPILQALPVFGSILASWTPLVHRSVCLFRLSASRSAFLSKYLTKRVMSTNAVLLVLVLYGYVPQGDLHEQIYIVTSITHTQPLGDNRSMWFTFSYPPHHWVIID